MGDKLSFILPKRVSYYLADKMASVYAEMISLDLKVLETNLRCALPANTSDAEIKKQSKKMIQNFSAYLVDLFYTRDLSEDFIKKNVEIRGRRYLEEALSEKKGVILASGHVGNWEMGGRVLARMGYTVHGVAIHHEDARIDNFFQKQRTMSGLRVIFPGDSFKTLSSALLRGEIVALVADRHYGGDAVPVDFMNRSVPMPQGILRLSRSTGASVLPTFFTMKDHHQYLLEIGPPLREEGESDLMQAFARRLEEIIQQHPAQWFIFQPFWEAPPWPL